MLLLMWERYFLVLCTRYFSKHATGPIARCKDTFCLVDRVDLTNGQILCGYVLFIGERSLIFSSHDSDSRTFIPHSEYKRVSDYLLWNPKAPNICSVSSKPIVN